MASRSKDERAHVNALIKAMQKNSPEPFYVYIDRDAGNMRHTSSGWDFHLSYNGMTVYCEAKEETEKLSDWQELTKALIEKAETPYFVVRFWDKEFKGDGGFFTIDNSEKFETARVTLAHFMN
jgi:hypothetical protein